MRFIAYLPCMFLLERQCLRIAFNVLGYKPQTRFSKQHNRFEKPVGKSALPHHNFVRVQDAVIGKGVAYAVDKYYDNNAKEHKNKGRKRVVNRFKGQYALYHLA